MRRLEPPVSPCPDSKAGVGPLANSAIDDFYMPFRHQPKQYTLPCLSSINLEEFRGRSFHKEMIALGVNDDNGLVRR